LVAKPAAFSRRFAHLPFFGLIRAAAEQTRPPPFAAALLAAAATLILVAQPLMRGLLQWPFHGLQIGWMIFATATGWALVRLPGQQTRALFSG